MGGCCGKRDAQIKTGDTTNLGGITSNEVPRAIEFATKFLKESIFFKEAVSNYPL